MCNNDQEERTWKSPDRRLPNIVVFAVSLKNSPLGEIQKKFSVDIQLISYSFLVELVNETFNLHSNFTLVAREWNTLKCDFIVSDDFDVDGCLMNVFEENEDEQKSTSILEFLVFCYPRTKDQIQSDTGDWCILETPSKSSDSKYQLIPIHENRIIVTFKSKDQRQETFLQKATGWFHGSVSSSINQSLTKKEFSKMLDPITGRLLDEQGFRQRIFETGCDESIRRIVWCYLLRVFNESMTNDDKTDYTNRAKDRYNEMKKAWKRRHEEQDCEVLVLETQIQKDVRRTDRSVKFFEDKENLSRQKLFHILITYSVYHPEPGYVQGMNDMAAAILYVVRDEALSYFCFCALMRHMSPLFDCNGVAMTRRLNLLKKTLRAIDEELWTKIEQCDVGKLMFAYRWLLLDCKREFPFKDIFRVLETLWASLPADRFESNNSSHPNSYAERDENCSSFFSSQYRSSSNSSHSNTMLSSRSSSSIFDDVQSQHSSFDGADSGYRDEQIATVTDFHLRSDRSDQSIYLSASSDSSVTTSSLPLGKWLTAFSTIDDEEQSSDMFTIFLCVALIEQNRSSIMQISSSNHDNDDFIGAYFTRLVRQHDSRIALQLARTYHRQYVLFQIRLKQLLATENSN